MAGMLVVWLDDGILLNEGAATADGAYYPTAILARLFAFSPPNRWSPGRPLPPRYGRGHHHARLHTEVTFALDQDYQKWRARLSTSPSLDMGESSFADKSQRDSSVVDLV